MRFACATVMIGYLECDLAEAGVEVSISLKFSSSRVSIYLFTWYARIFVAADRFFKQRTITRVQRHVQDLKESCHGLKSSNLTLGRKSCSSSALDTNTVKIMSLKVGPQAQPLASGVVADQEWGSRLIRIYMASVE